MIQINPLQSYIDGGARAALTTPPSASLVFDLPGKAIWVKGVKLKGIDHTYTFSHDNYITLTNTPDKNNSESEDINIGVNITTLKNAIDTTYNGGTLALLQEGLNTEERTWLAKILHNYINNILPITKNLQINGTNYAIYTIEDSLPLFYAPTSLGTVGQILAYTSSGLSWINQIQNTDYRVSLSSATNNSDYRIILKQGADNNSETTFVRFSEYLTFNPSTKTLKINNTKVVTATDIYVGATSTANATAGLVPTATSAQYTYFLRGDGTWVNIATEMAIANTWRPIKVENTDALGSGTDTGTLSFTAGTGITLAWDATNKRIIITNSSPDQNHNTDENVRQVPKTDNVNRPLMMINGDTSAGEQINTSMFSTGIYANASTKMITANGFIKEGSSDDYVLLGGGGHRLISNIVTSASNPGNYYVKYSKVTKSTADNTNAQPYIYNIENEAVVSGYYNYWYILNLGQYSGGNFGTLLAMPYQDNIADTELFIRSARNGSWRTWRRVLHSNNYSLYALPLSGGTMTGTIKFNGSASLPQKTLTFVCGIDAFANGGEMGWSYGSDFVAQYAPTKTGTGASGTWGINITGNADTVDGYHASSLVKFYLSPMASNVPADSAKEWFVNTMPSASAAIVYNVPGAEKTIIAGKSSGAYGHMLELNYNDNYLRILRYYTGSWKTTDWEKISAGYADNASTAEKLQTTRTLWGQSFDGTANVDNTIRIRQTTGNYCEGIRIQTADGAWSTIILGATSDSGTNTNAWSIHRKDDNNFAISRNSFDGVNGLVMTSIGMGLGTTSPTQRLDIVGNTKITGSIIASSAFINTGDSTLKVYSGKITDALSDGNICLQTSIDETDGQSHSYPTQYGNRCNLVLQPRGGQVYIGTNPDGGNVSYKLYVNGNICSNGFIKSGSSDDYVLLGGGGHRLFSDFVSYITIQECSTLNENSDIFKVEWAGGDNSIVTKPSGVDAFGVMKLRTARGWYGLILMSTNTAKGIYYRNAGSLTSSVSWVKLLDSTNQFWGQSFNGTNSISGDLSGVGAISRANASAVNTDVYGNLKFRQLNSQANCWWLVTLANDIAVLAVHNNGNVGIGTTTPSHKLDVVGNVKISGTGTLESASLKVYTSLSHEYAYGGSFLAPNLNTGHSILVNIGKNLTKYNAFCLCWHNARGDGNISNFGAVEILNAGEVQRWYGDLHSEFAGTVYATHYYETSDIRLKNIKSEVTISVEDLSKLSLFNFTWNNKTDNILYSGTSALEVIKILPTVVSYIKNYYQLDYATLGTIAGITACKELVTLKSELQELKEKVKLLEDRLRKYENTL